MVSKEKYVATVKSMLREHKAMVCSHCDTIYAEYCLREDGQTDYDTTGMIVTLSVDELADHLYHEARGMCGYKD
jgi:hypothetical protein